MDWANFVQDLAGQVVDTRLAVYKAQHVPQTVDPNTGQLFTDGQPATGSSTGGGNGSTMLLIGGAALVALMLLKD